MRSPSDQLLAAYPGHGTTYSTNATSFGHALPYGQVQYQSHGQLYTQNPIMNTRRDINVGDLARPFGSLGLHSSGSIGTGRSSNSTIPGNSTNSMNATQANGPTYYQLPDGTLLVSGVNAAQGNYQQPSGNFAMAPTQTTYLPQATYNGFSSSGQRNVPFVPNGHAWAPQHLSREVPDLAATRRTSWSSNEEAGPRTPFFGADSQGEYQPAVIVADRSPFAWSTPSPQQSAKPNLNQQLWKVGNGQYQVEDFDKITQKDPAIPVAIPAPWSADSGRGTLAKSVNNDLGTTNVYIRGLHPNTTDEMLHGYGERFGEIVRRKAIIDETTGLCKGFGFIEYHNYVQSENCIRGFFYLGYEAKYARESHNSCLKTLSDPDNTNLYLSNLPRDTNEAELMAIFAGYNVLSKKILRDQNALSRGVGFARFESHEKCEEIIKAFHGKPLGKDGAELQIRYADTDKQKDLKHRTTQRRQFKSNEYNTVAFGPSSPYHYYSPTSATFPTSLQTPVTGSNGVWLNKSPISPTFYGYPETLIGRPTPVMSGISGSATLVENIQPFRGHYSSEVKIESPSVVAAAKRTTDGERAVSNTPPSTPQEGIQICSSTPVTPHGNKCRTSPSKSVM